jgi:hypothetical protein
VVLAAPCNNNQGLIFFRDGDLCEDARALPADTAGNGDRVIWAFDSSGLAHWFAIHNTPPSTNTQKPRLDTQYFMFSGVTMKKCSEI